jgi:GT2 family glycosyltransferase
MTTKYPEYCAVIRTLGKAGDMYQQELDSLARQTVQPKRILVYIAEGYELPKETIGREEYIRCPKGMMTQRSLPFDEVDTDWILFLDDDIYLPDNGVERLFDGLMEQSGDCIAPATFEHAKASLFLKIVYVCLFQTLPHFHRDWAFRIRRDGGNSYNPHPRQAVLQTQSAPGTCCLCRTSSYHAVNMADERWIDSFHYAIGDDTLFYNKMYQSGAKILMHFNSGVTHLDAKSAHCAELQEGNLVTRTLRFVNWWRIVYSTQPTRWRRLLSFAAFTGRTIVSELFHIVFALLRRKSFYAVNVIRGAWRGWRYVHSAEYLSYPPFLADKKKL